VRFASSPGRLVLLPRREGSVYTRDQELSGVSLLPTWKEQFMVMLRTNLFTVLLPRREGSVYSRDQDQ